MPSAPQAPLFVREMGLPLRFALYLLACLALIALDSRYTALEGARQGVQLLMHPLRQLVAEPMRQAGRISEFFVRHGDLLADNQRLRREDVALRIRAQDRETLLAENANLRALLALPPREARTAIAAEIIGSIPNPFMRRVSINRGGAHGVQAGAPVVDARGLIGQVTRVYRHASEVTLLTYHEQGAPVQNLRNGLRLILSGVGNDALLEARFLDAHADLRAGDWLYTSGLDGVYPAGIPVARVLRVDPPRQSPFARAVCQPLGRMGHFRHVVVLTRAPGNTPDDPEKATLHAP